MSKKNILLLALLLGLLLAMTGCRTREMGRESPEAAALTGVETKGPGEEMGELEKVEAAETEASGEGESSTLGETEKSKAKTKENPEASRKEYGEQASAEILPGAEHPLESQGEGAGAPFQAEEAPASGDQTDDEAEQAATQTVAALEADQRGVDPEGEEADSALTYYTVLLAERMGSLFECKRVNVYWETAEDHVTVFKTSPEHVLILNAGAYDVSSRLLAENLKVDDGWVARKNPEVIVKMVDGSVLGSGVYSEGGARALCKSLARRAGWSEISAVRDGKILLLSEELMGAPYLQMVAMLAIAKASQPELMGDVDLAEALEQLWEEATGSLPAGIYYYQGGAT
ncbi:MAG: hypothetical protein IJ153_01365 [Clostridia bacterium]|nr:hypothetical protein [Clostridia bacterium]